jgi:hypothetical protein
MRWTPVRPAETRSRVATARAEAVGAWVPGRWATTTRSREVCARAQAAVTVTSGQVALCGMMLESYPAASYSRASALM